MISLPACLCFLPKVYLLQSKRRGRNLAFQGAEEKAPSLPRRGGGGHRDDEPRNGARGKYLHQLPPVLPINSFFSEFQINFFQFPEPSFAFPGAMSENRLCYCLAAAMQGREKKHHDLPLFPDHASSDDRPPLFPLTRHSLRPSSKGRQAKQALGADRTRACLLCAPGCVSLPLQGRWRRLCVRKTILTAKT